MGRDARDEAQGRPRAPAGGCSRQAGSRHGAAARWRSIAQRAAESDALLQRAMGMGRVLEADAQTEAQPVRREREELRRARQKGSIYGDRSAHRVTEVAKASSTARRAEELANCATKTARFAEAADYSASKRVQERERLVEHEQATLRQRNAPGSSMDPDSITSNTSQLRKAQASTMTPDLLNPFSPKIR